MNLLAYYLTLKEKTLPYFSSMNSSQLFSAFLFSISFSNHSQNLNFSAQVEVLSLNSNFYQLFQNYSGSSLLWIRTLGCRCYWCSQSQSYTFYRKCVVFLYSYRRQLLSLLSWKQYSLCDERGLETGIAPSPKACTSHLGSIIIFLATSIACSLCLMMIYYYSYTRQAPYPSIFLSTRGRSQILLFRLGTNYTFSLSAMVFSARSTFFKQEACSYLLMLQGTLQRVKGSADLKMSLIIGCI